MKHIKKETIAATLVSMCLVVIGSHVVAQSVRPDYDVDKPEPIEFGKIPFETMMYDQKAIDILLSSIVIPTNPVPTPPSPGGDCKCVAKGYPMFAIPLNSTIDVVDGTPVFTDYTDFELKASTNDFSHSLEDGPPSPPGKLLYWCGSSLSPRDPNRMDLRDSLMAYACNGIEKQTSPKHIADQRSWVPFPLYVKEECWNTDYIYVLLNTNFFSRTKNTSWCNSDNEEIVWSYTRFTPDGSEKIWHPIQPIKWYKEIPKWTISITNELQNIILTPNE